jgi:LDH2 family malate/lactate/ureidoglycolate dehydrogenase
MVVEYPGIENEQGCAHEALHRVAQGILERADRSIRECRSTPLAPGVARIVVPGAIAAEPERRQRTDGVPRNEVTVRGVRDAAVRLGVDASALR